MLKKFTKPVKWLIILLAIIVVASIGASLVQNSFFSVKVSRVSFETERGELAGYLYIPRGVDANNPAPAIVATHGYLNNAEMQEITAIEMSKRGFVVLAFSMYDHGDSKWETPAQFSFYVQAVYDAVQYMYDQDYVLKDADGNGMIGVTGHSMGGFSAETAVILDEMDFATNGYRKITVSLSLGSDFRYIPFADPLSYFGSRSSGMICSQYDQFFFDNVTDPALGTMRLKDFTSDPVGLAFLGRTAEGTAEAGQMYSDAGGQRVIYTPHETHPQNTWSLETGGYTIEFFRSAFAYQLDKGNLGTLASYGINTFMSGQSWWLKEAFTLIALLALFAMISPLFTVVTSLPVFNKVYKLQPAEGVVKSEKKRLSTVQLIIKITLITAMTYLSIILLTRFMDRADGLDGLVTAVDILMIVLAVGTVGLWVAYFVKKNSTDAESIMKIALRITIWSAIIVAISLAYRWLLTSRADIILTGHRWSAPSINTIVYWALAAGGLILITTLLANIYFNFDQKDKNPLGLKASFVQVGTSLLTAIALVIGVLFLVALIGWIFITDFRFYTYAIQIFNSQQFAAALKYIPLFFVYYFAAAVSIYLNTKNMKGWLADLLAAFLLAGPVILFLIYQYSTLYSTGVAAYPTFSLSSILCVGLVPTLAVAGIIMRRFGSKTGNIWTAVFFTSLFFTLITLANTTVYLLAA